MASHFINEPSSLVQEAIEGLLDYNPSLLRLDGFPDVGLRHLAVTDPLARALGISVLALATAD
jgi:hypothetical protein